MELLAFAQSWLDPEGNERSSPVQPKKATAMWEEPLVIWFLSERKLPLDQFELKQAVRVVVLQKFYASLREDIEVGPKGPRALFGALQDDLKCLKRECDRLRKIVTLER